MPIPFTLHPDTFRISHNGRIRNGLDCLLQFIQRDSVTVIQLWGFFIDRLLNPIHLLIADKLLLGFRVRVKKEINGEITLMFIQYLLLDQSALNGSRSEQHNEDCKHLRQHQQNGEQTLTALLQLHPVQHQSDLFHRVLQIKKF